MKNKLTDKKLMKSFLWYVFNTLHPTKKMISNWHIDLIIEYLDAVEMGDVKRLIVNLPPRSLKSICINVAWPAWILGNDPTKKIIAVSYSKRLSEKHSIDCRFVMQSEWYEKLFPDTKILRGSNTKDKFMTTQHGFRFATSTGATLTGEGADLIIIDDPCSAGDIFSPKKRAKVYNWFKQSLISRLNDNLSGKIVLVMQRLHQDDLTGLLLKNDHEKMWHHLKISAIAGSSCEIKRGDLSYKRLAGEQLYDNAMIVNKPDISLKNLKIMRKKDNICIFFSRDFLPDLRKTFHRTTMKNQHNVNIKLNIDFGDFSANYINSRRQIEEIKPKIHDLLFVYQNRFSDYFFSKYFPELLRCAIEKIVNKNDVGDSLKKKFGYDFTQTKQEVGNYVFETQYQQAPEHLDNTIIRREWLDFDDFSLNYDLNFNFFNQNVAEIDNEYFTLLHEKIASQTGHFDAIYQSWDCAIETGAVNDYSVCSTWGMVDNKYYLIDVFRKKLNYPGLKFSVLAMSKIFKPTAVLVENCASGQQIVQEMKYFFNGSFPMHAIRPRGNKNMRLNMVSPLFQQKKVILPKKAHWLETYLDELLCFPNVEHDDQVDSTSQLLLWCQQNAIANINMNNRYRMRIL